MKTRIVPALALAAAVALGTTGCNLLAPQATTYEYAPGDGIDVSLPSVDVRNLIVFAGEDNANVVFTAVNNGESATRLSMKFVDQGSQKAQKNFNVTPGLTPFGVDTAEVVDIADLLPGSVVSVFIESDGTEIERDVPVLDGTLDEYSELQP